ncbi:MAG: hypothetical protein AAGF87_04780 [Bacteroidota bacterium]
MKTLRYLFVLALLGAFVNTSTVNAQAYQSAVGLRLGVPLAVSYKTFINETSAIEAFVGYRSRTVLGFGWTQFNVVGLYQIHNEINEGFQWYYGGGAGVYIYSFDDGFGFDGEDDGTLSIGISGVVGIEYVFPDTPIAISADWIPTFFVNGFGNGFGAGFGSLGVRYLLGR